MEKKQEDRLEERREGEINEGDEPEEQQREDNQNNRRNFRRDLNIDVDEDSQDTLRIIGAIIKAATQENDFPENSREEDNEDNEEGNRGSCAQNAQNKGDTKHGEENKKEEGAKRREKKYENNNEDNQYVIKNKVRLPSDEAAKVVTSFAVIFFGIIQEQFEQGVPIELITSVIEQSVIGMRNQFRFARITQNSIVKNVIEAFMNLKTENSDQKSQNKPTE